MVCLLDLCFIVVTFSNSFFITIARNPFLKEKGDILLLGSWKQGFKIRNI